MSDLIRRLYNWTLRLGEHRYAKSGLCFLSFIESSIFPIPPDPLLFAMSAAKPNRALWFALLTTIFSVLGGVAGYGLGFLFWDNISSFFYTYIFSKDQVDIVFEQFHRNAFVAIFLAGLTPIPYKVFTISAGIASLNPATFIVASVLGRGLRFFLIGGALYFFGAQVRPWVERNLTMVTTVVGVLVIITFVVYKWMT